MGCDIHLYAEGYLYNNYKKEKEWININHWFRTNGIADIEIDQKNGGFIYDDLIDNCRDYEFFYLLGGVRGDESTNSYPPIAISRGLPKKMDPLIYAHETEYIEIGSIDFHHPSYLTLYELEECRYSKKMHLKGWVLEEEYLQMLERSDEVPYLPYIDEKSPHPKEGFIFKEWDGYINLTLLKLIDGLKKLKVERKIENDKEIRVVFWFDN